MSDEKRRMTVYVHASREQAYDAAAKLGLTGDALRLASYAGYEHKMTYEVDETGDARLVAVDDRELLRGPL